MENKSKKSETLKFRIDPQTMQAIEFLAVQLGCNKSELARQALLKQLESVHQNARVLA